jgi:hypothetical protein
MGTWYQNITTPDAALCPPSSKGHVDCKGTSAVDTTTLANGWHRLFIRADSLVPQNDPVLMAANAKNGPAAQIGGGTFSSVVMTAFQVSNEKPPPPPSPPPPSPPPLGEIQAIGATVAAPEPASAEDVDAAAVKATIADDLSSGVLGTLHGGQSSTGAVHTDAESSDLALAGAGMMPGGGIVSAGRQSVDSGMGSEAYEVVMLDTASGEAVAVTGGSGAEAVAAALTQAVQGGAGEEVAVAAAAAAAAAGAVVGASNVMVVKRLVMEPKLVEMDGLPVTW